MKRSPLRQRSARRGQVERLDAICRLAMIAKYGEKCILAEHVTCVRCFGHLDAMHIIGKQGRPDLRHKIVNLLPGCRAHHDWAGRNPREASLIMLSVLSDEDRAELQKLTCERR